MTVMTDSQYPPARSDLPLTVHDLEGIPEDGRRYELIDGTLIVSPAPGLRHQRIGLRLFSVLDAACPDAFIVVAAPFAVHDGSTDKIELQPDVLVGRDEDFTEKDLPAAPVLVVEVLSPSTALIDWNLKKSAYERMGVENYWVIDPLEPALTVFELNREGVYEQMAKTVGDEPFEASKPFPARVVLNELLGRLAGR